MPGGEKERRLLEHDVGDGEDLGGQADSREGARRL